ncbi:helix-turn-helix domain-containing protein [Vibrio sinaloensis]|nr:helix-turn-helix domain-containing protein [Vibrio sinaloensis]
MRLDNACRRLLAGEKVSDVAFECGFNDPSYFSQRFKHRFGVPPTQFVEQKKNTNLTIHTPFNHGGLYLVSFPVLKPLSLNDIALEAVMLYRRVCFGKLSER